MKDVRYTNPKGFTPNKVDTTTLIKTYGWDTFELVDLPVEKLLGFNQAVDDVVNAVIDGRESVAWIDPITLRVSGEGLPNA